MYFYNIEILLKWCQIVGGHPLKGECIIQHIIFATSLFTNLSIVYLAVSLLVYKEGKITVIDIADTFSASSMVLHGLIRIITMYKNRQKFKNLLEMMSNAFWKVEDVEDIETRQYCNQIRATAKKSFQVFVCLCAATASTYSIVTIIEGENLPWNCYRPKWISFNLLLLYQTLINIFGVNMPIICMDILMMTFISLTRVQFALLNYEFTRIYDTDGRNELQPRELQEKLKKVVKHHIFLLHYSECINDCFSTSLLVYMMFIVLSMCIEMYNICTKGTFKMIMRSMIYLSAALFQFVVCSCLPGQGLTDEAEKLPDTIYLSKWLENGGQNLDIILVMANGQRKIAITAGGIINIDLSTSLSTVRSMISYCMFLQSVGIN